MAKKKTDSPVSYRSIMSGGRSLFESNDNDFGYKKDQSPIINTKEYVDSQNSINEYRDRMQKERDARKQAIELAKWQESNLVHGVDKKATLSNEQANNRSTNALSGLSEKQLTKLDDIYFASKRKPQDYQPLIDEYINEYGGTKEDVRKLVQYRQNVKNIESTETKVSEAKQKVSDHPILGALGETFDANLKQYVSAGNGLLETINKLGGGYADEQMPISTYSTGGSQARVASAVAEQTKENIDNNISNKFANKAVNFLYDLYNSGTTNTINRVVSQAVAATTGIEQIGEAFGYLKFFESGYNQSLIDSQNKGLDENRAIALGIANGAAEVIGELLPFHQGQKALSGLFKGTATKEMIAKVLASSRLTEAFGEIATDVIDYIADIYIAKDKSDRSQVIDYYMSKEGGSYSKDEAEKKATEQFIKDAAYDGALGYVSGAVGQAAARGGYTATTAMQGKSLSKDTNLLQNILYNKNSSVYVSEDRADYSSDADFNKALQTRDQALKTLNDTRGNRKATLKEGYTLADNLKSSVADVQSNKTEVPNEFKTIKQDLDTALKSINEANTPYQLAKAMESLNAENNSTKKAYKNAIIRLEKKGFTADDVQKTHTAASIFTQSLKGEALDESVLDSIPESDRAVAKEALKRGTNLYTIRNNTASAIVSSTGDAIAIDLDKGTVKDSNGNVSIYDKEGNTHSIDSLESVGSTKFALNSVKLLEDPEAAKAVFKYMESNKDVDPRTLSIDYSKIFNAAKMGISEEELKKKYGETLKTKNTDVLFKELRDSADLSDSAKIATYAKKGKGNVTFKDNDKEAKRVFSELSKGEREFFKAFGKKLGVDFEFFVDSTSATRGEYIPEEGKITINLAKINKVFSIALHEGIGEFLQAHAGDKYNLVATRVIEYYYDKNSLAMTEKVQQYLNLYQSNGQADKSLRAAANEFVNDTLGDIFKTDEGIRDFINWLKTDNETKNVFTKYFKDIANWIKEVRANGQYDHDDVLNFDDAIKDAEEIRKMFLASMNEAIANRDALAADSSNMTKEEITEVLFEAFDSNNKEAIDEFLGKEPKNVNRNSLEFDQSLMDKAFKVNSKTGNVNPLVLAQAQSARKIVKDQLDTLKEYLPEDIMGNVIEKNGSYGRSIENSVMCIRSIVSRYFMNKVAEKLNKPLSVSENLIASQILAHVTGDQRECSYCYVAMDRRTYESFFNNYYAQYEDVFNKVQSNPDAYEKDTFYGYEEFLNGRKDTDPMKKRYEHFVNDALSGTKSLSLADLTTAEKRAKVKGKNQKAWLVKDAERYCKGATWAKNTARAVKIDGTNRYAEYLAYNGNILRMSDDLVKILNDNFGIRMYSDSDYVPAFLLENMQEVTDAAVRGLKMLSYTKDTGFAEVFAPTGMAINISVFGGIENGKVYEDGMMGASWEEAKKLRQQYENVGTVFVATNDELVEWALDQDWIDVVIPFHLVRTGDEVAAEFGYQNYKSIQEDKKTKEWKEGNLKSIPPTVHKNDLDTYKESLKSNNLTPRFDKWIDDNPNYMKLVNETRMSYKDLYPVQPIFDMDAAKRQLARIKTEGVYGLLQGVNTIEEQDFILDDYVDEAVKSIKSKRQSLDPSEYESKAKEHFGLTDDFRVAGYLLTDGTMLDFSGAHWLEGYDDKYIADWKKKNDIRQVDHEDIYEVLDRTGDNRKQFMEMGEIRLVPEASGINLSTKVEPTATQYRMIKEYVRTIKSDPYYDNIFRVDLEGDKPSPDKNIYEGANLNEDKIVNDLKLFYSTGSMPKQSDIGNFRYSLDMESGGNGYDGYSMSNNARLAYENGEKPLSKWSKVAIIDAVREIDEVKAEMLSKLNLKTLKDTVLSTSSWHHTSEFYNKTDFYSVDENIISNLTEKQIIHLATQKESKALGREFRGDIEYLEWSGTRNHPKATKKTLADVNIEERGSFYYVTDDDGKQILKKKINSNGTYVTDYDEVAKKEKARLDQEKTIKENSSKDAYELYKKFQEEGSDSSWSGNIYALGRKPSSFDVARGLDSFFDKGEKRLSPNAKGGYDIETWLGDDWQKQSQRKSLDFAPVFYSKMNQEIESIKQDKISAASVISYLKGKGVKDEEIKWSGIETFLEGKKSVTKQELLDFAKANEFVLEEKTLGLPAADLYFQFEQKLDELGITGFWMDSYIGMDDEFEPDGMLEDLYDLVDEEEVTQEQYDAFEEFYNQKADQYGDSEKTKWDSYTLDGTTNYREILFKMPNSDYSNEAMQGHWNDTGVLAHARIDDLTLPDGSKTLFVEEIQSDWHNEGKKEGYINENEIDHSLLQSLIKQEAELDDKYFNSMESELSKYEYVKSLSMPSVIWRLADGDVDLEYVLKMNGVKFDKLYDIVSEYKTQIKDIYDKKAEATAKNRKTPDAPYKNTYTDYVMKRLLRVAAEGGYDYIGWTTGKMQEERWSDEYAEGYHIEYDQDIPKFMNKYGKQWNAKVKDIEIYTDNKGYTIQPVRESYVLLYKNYKKIASVKFTDLKDNATAKDAAEYFKSNGYRDVLVGEVYIHAVKITSEMKDSVLHKGQARFSLDPNTDQTYMELAKDPEKNKKKLQQMVDKAAKAAGYNVRAYHGTQADYFTVFDTYQVDNNMGSHFGSEEIAQGFASGEFGRADNEKNARVINVYLKANNPYDTYDWFGQDDLYPMAEAVDIADQIGTEEALAIKENILSINDEFREVIESGDLNEMHLDNDADRKKLYGSLRDLLKLGGYDSILYENGLEVVGEWDYIMQEANQIKLADPVTYDDNGNIIPLSERFNEKKDDFRFSLEILGDASPYASIMKDVNATKNIMDKVSSTEVSGRKLYKKSINDLKFRLAGKYNISFDSEFINELTEDLKTFDKYMRSQNVDNDVVLEHALQIADEIRQKAHYFAGGSDLENDLVIAMDVVSMYYETVSKQNANSKKAEKLDYKSAKVLDSAKTEIENKQKNLTTNLNNNFGQMVEYELNKINYAISKGARKYDGLTKEQIKKLAYKRAVDKLLSEKEMAEKAKCKDRIIRTSTRLINWMAHPTDQKHVPEFLKDPLLDAIASVDFMPTSLLKGVNPNTNVAKSWAIAMRRLNKVIEEINSAGRNESDIDDYQAAQKYNLSLKMEAENLVLDMNKFLEEHVGTLNISNLDSQSMKELARYFDAISKAINNMNSLYKNRRFETSKELGDACIAEMKAIKPVFDKSRFPAADAFHEFLNLEMLEPISFFEEMGKSSASIMDEFFDGEKRGILIIREAEEFFDKLHADLGLTTDETGKWSDDLHQFKIDGVEITLSTADIMGLYASNKEETLGKQNNPDDATYHIESGGIVASKKKVGTKTYNYNPTVVHPSKNELEKIFKTLNNTQIKYIDRVVEYMSTTLAAHGNKTSQDMYGYDKFNGSYYYPLKTDNSGIATNEGNAATNQVALRALINPSFTKTRINRADNALVVMDFFDVVTDHISGMANYCAYAEVVSDTLVWYNYAPTERTPNGESWRRDTYGIKNAMKRVKGAKAPAYLETFIRDVNLENKVKGNVFQDKLIGMAKAQAVTGNMRVVVQQPCAITRALDVIEQKYLNAGMAQVTKNPVKMTKYAQKKSYLCYWKSKGFSDYRVAQGMKEIIVGNNSKFKDVVEATGMLAGAADDVTWAAMYIAAEAKIKATRSDLKVGSSEFDAAVEELFSDIINHTQVIDSTLRKTETNRSKNGLVKLANAFMNEPQKTYNMLHRKINAYYQQGKSEVALKALRKMVAIYCYSAFVTAVAQSVADAFRDDDDEKWWYKFLEALLPVEAVNSIKEASEKGTLSVWTFIGCYGQMGNFFDQLNPVNLIPFFAEASNIAKGYKSQRMDTQIFTQIASTMSTLEKGSTPYGTIYSIAQTVSYATGAPFAATLREVKVLYNNTIGALTGHKWYGSKSQKEKVEKSKATKATEQVFNSNDLSATKAFIQSEYDAKIADGKDESTAWSAVRTTLKEQYLREISEGKDKASLKNKYTTLLKETKVKKNGSYVGLDSDQAYKSYIAKWNESLEEEN